MLAATELEEVRQWRHNLHRRPETAFQEHATSAFVVEKLREFGIAEIHKGLAGTGVLAALRFGEGPSIALRADMDALPLQELNEFAHASATPGRMHACGHDGHTAMLLGAARELARCSDLCGTLFLIFQPAEEKDGGARVMLEEGLLQRFAIEEFYGLHNWPGMPLGTMGIHRGAVMAACDFFEITIRGRGGHAAMPQQTIDPVLIAAELSLALQRIVSRMNPLESAVLSVTVLRAGEAYNIIPESCFLAGTVRTFSEELRNWIEAQVIQTAQGIAAAHGARAECNYLRGYPAAINAAAEAEHCLAAAREAVGAENAIVDPPPSMGSEDFAYFFTAAAGLLRLAGNRPGRGYPGAAQPEV